MYGFGGDLHMHCLNILNTPISRKMFMVTSTCYNIWRTVSFYMFALPYLFGSFEGLDLMTLQSIATHKNKLTLRFN